MNVLPTGDTQPRGSIRNKRSSGGWKKEKERSKTENKKSEE